jgi:hypothetical protein
MFKNCDSGIFNSFNKMQSSFASNISSRKEVGSPKMKIDPESNLRMDAGKSFASGSGTVISVVDEDKYFFKTEL